MFSKRRRWQLYAAIPIAVLGISALIWALDLRHVRRPLATLTAESSGLELAIADRPTVLEWRPVQSLFALDVAAIIDIATGRPVEDADGDARFTSPDGSVESLTLESISLPVGAVLAMQSREAPSEWDVEIKRPGSEPVALRLSSAQPVTMIARGAERHLAPPVGLELRFHDRSVRLIVPPREQRLL